jgi:hypothetical protein
MEILFGCIIGRHLIISGIVDRRMALGGKLQETK